MDALHGHLLRLCAAQGCTQKGQVSDIQPPAAIGFPVRRGVVKSGGIPRLPACTVIVRADEPAQVNGFCRRGIGRDQQILQPGQRKTFPLHKAAVLHTARSGINVDIQRTAADFRQPYNGCTQHRRAGFVGHGLQCVQRQCQHRAQRQGGQKQHRAKCSHCGGGQRLVCAVGLQVGGISGGSLTAPQPFARHRPRRRTGTQPARQKQQPA